MFSKLPPVCKKLSKVPHTYGRGCSQNCNTFYYNMCVPIHVYTYIHIYIHIIVHIYLSIYLCTYRYIHMHIFSVCLMCILFYLIKLFSSGAWFATIVHRVQKTKYFDYKALKWRQDVGTSHSGSESQHCPC